VGRLFNLKNGSEKVELDARLYPRDETAETEREGVFCNAARTYCRMGKRQGIPAMARAASAAGSVSGRRTGKKKAICLMESVWEIRGQVHA